MKRSIAAAVATAIGLILMAAPSTHAQGTINAIGKVVDAQGNPVPDVKVLLDYKGHIVQKYRTKTDKNGVFTHVRVYSGPYRITLTKDGVGEVSFNASLQEVDSLQQPPEYKFVPKVAVAAPPPGSGLAPAAATPAAAPVDMSQLTNEINNAIALSKSGDTDGAIAGYEAILAKTPEIPLVHYNLGTLYKKKGDAARAQAEMEKAVALDPRFVDGYVGLATLLAESGKKAEAIAVDPEGDDREPAERAAPVRARRARRRLGGGRPGEGGLPEGRAARPAELRDAVPPGHRRPEPEQQGRGGRAAREVHRRRPPGHPEPSPVAKSLLAALQKK